MEYLFTHITWQKNEKRESNGTKGEYKSRLKYIDGGWWMDFIILRWSWFITKSVVPSHTKQTAQFISPRLKQIPRDNHI